jgi:two-component sensor histidine kinase
MSTNRGLCRLNPETGLVRSYTVNDGLQSNEFNRYSAYRAADGTMYFGGVNGLTWFHPSEVAQGSVIPAIVITDLIGINGPVLGADGWPVDPLTARQLVRQSADAMLRIRFTALDFFAADRLIYRYKLDGLHEQWIDLGRSRELTFPDLPPGTYTLRLAASSGDGNWTEQENGMIITIRPAWYATWLFRLLVLALAVALVIYIYRIRVRRMVELQRIRDHIARDLHDEIGSSLSSISIYSKVVMENSERPVKDLLPVLQRIRETSQRMMESMSDIVWAINTRHDDWPQLIQRMRAAAIELTEARNMQLRFHADDIPERIPLDMEKRRNIYLLFKEAVNNSVKYANATSLDVRLERHGDVMRLEISDNGVGFQPEQVIGGNGLVNMNSRAAMLGGILRIESSRGQGTRITLELK